MASDWLPPGFPTPRFRSGRLSGSRSLVSRSSTTVLSGTGFSHWTGLLCGPSKARVANSLRLRATGALQL